MTLSDVRPGEECLVSNLHFNNLRKRLIDLGLTTGTLIRVKKMAPLGDPMEIWLRGYLLTLRKAEARSIEVEKSQVSRP